KHPGSLPEAHLEVAREREGFAVVAAYGRLGITSRSPGSPVFISRKRGRRPISEPPVRAEQHGVDVAIAYPYRLRFRPPAFSRPVDFGPDAEGPVRPVG